MLMIWGRNSSVNVQKVLWCSEEIALPYARIDAGGPFGILGGDAFSGADIALGCGIWRWMSLPIDRPGRPHVQRWFDTLAQRPAHRKGVMQPLA